MTDAPRVLRVDDWALRRGQRHGTIVLDLERHQVIDFLPDRDSATLAAWLRAHPGLELISRDRSGAYAQGARLGAPEAIQIADRFHLVKNLMEAIERACTRHHAALQTAAATTYPIPPPRETVRQGCSSGLPHHHAGPTQAEQRSTERRARRRARYERVVRVAAGRAPSGVAETMGMDRQTIRGWLAAGQCPEQAPSPDRRHRVDPFLDDILDRYDAGLDNAAALARALWANGFPGSYQTVRRSLATLRRMRPRDGARLGLRPAGRAPAPRQTTWLLRNAAAELEDLTSEERANVATLTTACPALAPARTLAYAFGQMFTAQNPNGLAAWLADAELGAFAAALRRDHDAVLAVVFPWSNGQVEGHVHRLNLLKRTMYSRAGFALLRKRVLRAARERTSDRMERSTPRSPKSAQSRIWVFSYKEIQRDGMRVRRAGRRRPPATRRTALQAILTHQPGDAFCPDGEPLVLRLALHAWRPVGPATLSYAIRTLSLSRSSAMVRAHGERLRDAS